ncbi:bifunctional DNA primase/polymerase [Microbacterium sp. cx-55]|uniref:bifunctional DNA primase/polymerase n=1 Tax=Microbacterium sp. cx-55 TaxID=2875948 RepID=UPI001CC02A25|nr:bifunctional DNA primase/polymerase [Microbacterium sp. cx-55]MBZ4488022.1 bifunctional DNA primase/polymerase [Microbacterium sp. cx-55]UGB34572.1 bifunctional DNA primase/polymerase [Microbacterium sp. cx-55]
MTALDRALAAARLGWHVLPVNAKKRAIVKSWETKATTDEATIRGWAERHPDALFAVAAGPSGLAIADLDVDAGKDGHAALQRLGYPLPPTWMQDTPRGGSHAFYVAPVGVDLPNGTANLFEVDSGIDRRTGNSYAVLYSAPPTSVEELAPAPEWLTSGDARRPAPADRASNADESAFRARLGGGKASKAVKKATKNFRSEGMSHDDLLTGVTRLVTLGVQGHPGVGKALDTARATYAEGWGSEYLSHFDKALAGSIRRLGLPPVTFALSKAQRRELRKRQAARLVGPERPQPVSLAACHDAFRGWLGIDYDLGALDAVLATAVIERMDGDPAWLWLVSGSGNAKTETVQSLAGAGALVLSSVASEGALLSATSKGERSTDATGGLLRQIGESGILVIKDGTSMLSGDRTARGQVFAAFREVHDGHWVRNVGTDGGRSLEWKGRLVVIGAITTAWDRAHADTISAFGDRFVIVRMDSSVGRIAAGRKAIGNTGSEEAMRAELSAVVAGVLEGADINASGPDDDEAARILAAADLVTLARTAVDLDYRGNVVDSHAPEMPTRFAKQLAQIFRGAVAIGRTREDALALAIRVARDSMPPLRLEVLEDVAANPWSPLRDVVKRVDKPRSTVDRQLQALHLLGLLTVDEEVATVGLSLKETTTWRYTVADGIDVASIADPTTE